MSIKKQLAFLKALVQPRKPEKIDLNTQYNCPCRRRGYLVPITLTEAFGCDSCQNIFVVEDNGYILEQLSHHHGYKRAWRWIGNTWQIVHPNLGESYLPMTLGIIFFLVFGWLPLALRLASGTRIIAWAIVPVLLVILPAIIYWLTYRR